MVPLVVLYVLVFNTCDALPTIHVQPNTRGSDLADLTNSAISDEWPSPFHELQSRVYNMDFDGFSTEKRKKRAVKIIGEAQVLLDATFLDTYLGAKWYQKSGGYQQAVADFYSLKPTHVQKLADLGDVEAMGLIGSVLGEIILVRPRGQVINHPILSIGKRITIEYPDNALY